MQVIIMGWGPGLTLRCPQEAEVEHRVAEMKREGFWSLRRLPKVPEPPRPKVHWDYLCEEMQWLAADFAQERRWKRGVARKVGGWGGYGGLGLGMEGF